MSKTFENSGSEKDFLKIYSNEELDKYAKPSVTVDSVIFRYFEERVQTLLIKRKNHPYMGDVYKRQVPLSLFSID